MIPFHMDKQKDIFLGKRVIRNLLRSSRQLMWNKMFYLHLYCEHDADIIVY